MSRLLDHIVLLILPGLMVVGGVFVGGCAETGVDPDTAKVIGGDIADSIPELDLQKASVSAGFVGGAGGNSQIESFIRFERRVRYMVDTLDDGSPTGLRNIILEATLDRVEDEGDEDHSNPFHPMKGVRLEIPSVRIRPNGKGDVPILGNTASALQGPASLVVTMVRPGESADLYVREDSTYGEYGMVEITSVNPRDRVISMRISARLYHEVADRLPRSVFLTMLFELPY